MSIKTRMLEAWSFVRELSRRIEGHELFSHAAATAFFLFFSIPPLVLALVTLLGLIPIDEIVGTTASEVLGWIYAGLKKITPLETAYGITCLLAFRSEPFFAGLEEFASVDLRERISAFLNAALPEEAASAIGGIAGDILGKAHPGLLTMSFVGVLWAAGAATRSTTRAMNAIYEVKRSNFLLRNLRSIVMTVFILGAFLVALVVFPLLQGLIVAFGAIFGLGSWFSWVGVGFGWLAQLFALVFVVVVLQRIAPRAGHTVKSVLRGSLVTVALWVLLSVGLGVWMSFGWQRYNATYGTLAGVILLLLWCYLASLALLFGAELNSFAWSRGGELNMRRRRRARALLKAREKGAKRARANEKG